MDKINLIFFIPEFIKGGAGNSILSLVKNLDKNKFFINIICLGKSHYKNEISKYAKVYELNCKKTLFSQFKLNHIIKKIISSNRKNILISNFFYANVLIALFQQRKKNLRFIFVERTTLSELFIYFGIIDFLKKFILKILVKFLYKKAYIIVANSKKVSNDIQRYTNTKCIHIYPGSFKNYFITGSFKNYLTKRGDYKNEKLNITWLGRLSKEKGIEDVLSALKNIKRQNYILNIVGEGNKKKQIERFIKIEKLDNKVKLLGFRKNISSILKKSDLLINSSYFEGFPNVVVEALAFQVPTICSKSGGGVFEILKNGKYGDLYNKGDISSLRIKIESHIKNPKRLIKKSYLGYQDLKRFSEKVSAKKYEKLFLGVKF